MATAANIIRQAYLKTQALGWDDTVETQLNTDGLEMLNNLIASLSAERLVIPSVTEFSNALTVGKATYTIGTGGDFNVARPIDLAEAYIRDTQGIDWPVVMFTREEYAALADKNTSRRPEKYYFTPEYPLAKIIFDSLPTAAETLYLNIFDYLSEISDVNDTLNIPPEYKRMLIYNLAVDMGPEWGGVHSDVAAIAKQSKLVIKRNNSQPVAPVKVDDALIWRGYYRKYYNIFTD